MRVVANNIRIAIITLQFKIAVHGVQPAVKDLFNMDFARFKYNASRGFLCAIPGITVHLNGNRFQGSCWLLSEGLYLIHLLPAQHDNYVGCNSTQ